MRPLLRLGYICSEQPGIIRDSLGLRLGTIIRHLLIFDAHDPTVH